jgi:hypothetical protein
MSDNSGFGVLVCLVRAAIEFHQFDEETPALCGTGVSLPFTRRHVQEEPDNNAKSHPTIRGEI